MKLRRSKKGFTIVELVIVIAVIAVLSAVLIPTFISLTNKANKASNQSLVKNLNTALAAREGDAEDTKNNTMHDAVLDLKAYGYELSNLVAKSNEKLLWNSKTNRFFLESDKAKDANAKGASGDYDYWRIQKSYTEADTQYSIYASEGFETAAITNLQVGFDAGYNETITSVSYVHTSGAAQEVVIRTNSQFTNLAVNAPNDVVTHYGIGKALEITAVAPTSFHEKGAWQTITLTSGNLVLETGSFVGKVIKNGGTLENNGVIAEAITGTAASEGITGNGTVNIINSSTSIQVGNAETLMNLAMAQSTGVFGNSPLNIELTSSIDITGKTWVPFGAERENLETYRFSGTIDGKGYSIIGLTNGTYKGKISQNNTTTVVGENYGFIALATGSVTVKNLTFDKVNINAKDAKVCGVVIGLIGDDISQTAGTDVISNERALKLINVVVNGNVVARDKIGGLVGYLYNRLPNTNIEDCHVNANLTLTGDGTRANGLFGMISNAFNYPTNSNLSYKANTTITDCSFNGKISMGDTTGEKTRISAIAFINNPISYTEPDGSQNPRSRIYVTNFTVGDSFVLDYSGKTEQVIYCAAGSVEKAICKD